MRISPYPPSPEAGKVLEGWLRSPSIRAGLAQRARIVLLAADGVGTNAIAGRVGAGKQTVIMQTGLFTHGRKQSASWPMAGIDWVRDVSASRLKASRLNDKLRQVRRGESRSA